MRASPVTTTRPALVGILLSLYDIATRQYKRRVDVATPLIVLIDNEPLLWWSVATDPTRHGYRVETAATATAGLALLRAIAPDLLLARHAERGRGRAGGRRPGTRVNLTPGAKPGRVECG